MSSRAYRLLIKGKGVLIVLNMQGIINSEKLGSSTVKNKRAIIALIGVAVLALLVGGIWWNNLRTTITTDNAKIAGDIVDISARTSGLLVEILVKEGDQVKVGQVLAHLDDSQAKINLAQAEAALEIARANTSKLPTDITSAQAAVTRAQETGVAGQSQAASAVFAANDAKRQLDKMQALYDQGALAKESLDQARTRYDTARANVDAQAAAAASAQAGVLDAQAKLEALNNTGLATYKALLKQAQAIYDNAKFALDNTVIKSQVNGTIVRLPVQVGENIIAGQSVITISNLQQVWVTANVQEKQVGRIRVGQSVDVRIDAYPG
ncbi:MAG: HlyD family secretion protein, partial [Methylocystaceae bacterium]